MINQLKEMEAVRQQMKREAFEEAYSKICKPIIARPYPRNEQGEYFYKEIHEAHLMWQVAQEQMPTSQHTSILHDIDCYFDNANNTKRNADNLIQDIYEHLTEEAKANTVPKGFVLMPIEATDEIAEAIAFSANCCGGIADDIYQAILQTVQKQLPNDQALEKPQSNAFLSAVADMAQKVSSGEYVLVPKEPTLKMVNAYKKSFDEQKSFSEHQAHYLAYKAMLEASKQ